MKISALVESEIDILRRENGHRRAGHRLGGSTIIYIYIVTITFNNNNYLIMGTVRLSSAKGSYRRGLLPPIVWGEFKASQPIDARPTRSQLSRPTPSGHFIHMARSAYAVNNTSYTHSQTQDGRTGPKADGRTAKRKKYKDVKIKMKEKQQDEATYCL